MSRRMRSCLRAFARSWIGTLVIAAVLALSFKSAIADWNVVPTGSMKPTIVEGDRIFVNKLAYDLKIPFTTMPVARWGEPRRGDIVVFHSPRDGSRLVKRIIGLPGETVAMESERLFIDGVGARYEEVEAGEERIVLREEYGRKKGAVMVLPGLPALRSFGPVTVPSDAYLVLGDNRDNSADSRYFGFVPRDRIVGRATAVVLSLDYDNHYLPRKGRFFRGLE